MEKILTYIAEIGTVVIITLKTCTTVNRCENGFLFLQSLYDCAEGMLFLQVCIYLPVS